MRYKIILFIILFFFYSGNLYSKCNFNTANHIDELNDPKSIENISIKIKNNVKFTEISKDFKSWADYR